MLEKIDLSKKMGKKEFNTLMRELDAKLGRLQRVCKEKRIPVPTAMSVIGVNDMENTRFIEPMLTTMSVHTAEMGGHVVRLLIDRINKKHFTPVKLYIPSHLIVRESCAPPR